MARYTDEYRREAADYVIDSGKRIDEAASDLGVNRKTLGNWVAARRKERGLGRAGAMPGGGEMDAAAMRRRIRELEMENEFLKKASAFFAARQRL